MCWCAHTQKALNPEDRSSSSVYAAVPMTALVEDLTTGPVPFGSNLLIEYNPVSQWHNASLTIAAGWLKTGGRVSYNVFTQPPTKVRARLKRLGLKVDVLEGENKLRIHDWYAATLGKKSVEKLAHQSLKVADQSIEFSKWLSESQPQPDLLRMDDDSSTVARFNEEKNWTEFVLTRDMAVSPVLKSTMINSLTKGVHSECVYKRFEAAFDGVIEVELDETGKATKNMIRIRNMRDVGFNHEWHQLRIGDNLEVTLEK
jgi:KaiC/GvpD/RAD55 family RecA-like ATPase